MPDLEFLHVEFKICLSCSLRESGDGSMDVWRVTSDAKAFEMHLVMDLQRDERGASILYAAHAMRHAVGETKQADSSSLWTLSGYEQSVACFLMKVNG